MQGGARWYPPWRQGLEALPDRVVGGGGVVEPANDALRQVGIYVSLAGQQQPAVAPWDTFEGGSTSHATGRKAVRGPGR